MKAKSANEVKLAYKKAKQLFPDSDHIVMAYTFKTYTGWQDNLEYGAGKKLLELIKDHDKHHNTVLFITRKTTGMYLGPRRFMYIQKVAKEALTKLKNIF